MDDFKIAFEMSRTVVQKISIVNPEYTKEMIIAGLRNGSLVTLTPDECVGDDYIVDEDYNNIARITRWEEEAHFELENFRNDD